MLLHWICFYPLNLHSKSTFKRLNEIEQSQKHSRRRQFKIVAQQQIRPKSRSATKYRSHERVYWNETSTNGNSVNVANEEIASKHSCQTRFRDRVRLLKPYSLKYQKKIKNVAVIKGLKDHENFKFRRVTLQKLILQVWKKRLTEP